MLASLFQAKYYGVSLTNMAIVGMGIVLYLFAEFVLEWLRDGSTRQIVFGEVRFNQMQGVFVPMLHITKLTDAEAPEQPVATFY